MKVTVLPCNEIKKSHMNIKMSKVLDRSNHFCFDLRIQLCQSGILFI